MVLSTLTGFYCSLLLEQLSFATTFIRIEIVDIILAFCMLFFLNRKMAEATVTFL